MVIEHLKQWDGKSDIILITENPDGIVIKLCPAELMHHILGQYQEFLRTHKLVLKSDTIDDQFLVLMRWENRDA